MEPGNSCISWAIAEDNARKAKAQKAALETTKEARTARLVKKKAKENAGGDGSYLPGGD